MAEIDLHEEADIAEVLRAAGEASVSALTAVEEKLGPTSARTMAIRAALGEQAPLALQVETPDDNRSKWKSPTDKDAVLNRKFPMHYADLQEYQYSRLQECPTSLLARYQSQAYQVEDWANAVIFQQMLFRNQFWFSIKNHKMRSVNTKCIPQHLIILLLGILLQRKVGFSTPEMTRYQMLMSMQENGTQHFE